MSQQNVGDHARDGAARILERVSMCRKASGHRKGRFNIAMFTDARRRPAQTTTNLLQTSWKARQLESAGPTADPVDSGFGQSVGPGGGGAQNHDAWSDQYTCTFRNARTGTQSKSNFVGPIAAFLPVDELPGYCDHFMFVGKAHTQVVEEPYNVTSLTTPPPQERQLNFVNTSPPNSFRTLAPRTTAEVFAKRTHLRSKGCDEYQKKTRAVQKTLVKLSAIANQTIQISS